MHGPMALMHKQEASPAAAVACGAAWAVYPTPTPKPRPARPAVRQEEGAAEQALTCCPAFGAWNW